MAVSIVLGAQLDAAEEALDPTGQPLAVSTGCNSMWAVDSTGRATALPAAFKNSSLLLMRSICARAWSSPTRIRSISRPCASKVPTSARMVNCPSMPWMGTWSSTTKVGPLRRSGGASSLALRTGGASMGAWACATVPRPPPWPEHRRGQRQRNSDATASSLGASIRCGLTHARVSRGSWLTLTGGLAVNSSGPWAAPGPGRFDRRQ